MIVVFLDVFILDHVPLGLCNPNLDVVFLWPQIEMLLSVVFYEDEVVNLLNLKCKIILIKVFHRAKIWECFLRLVCKFQMSFVCDTIIQYFLNLFLTSTTRYLDPASYASNVRRFCSVVNCLSPSAFAQMTFKCSTKV